jgi:cytochrome c peroxidase
MIINRKKWLWILVTTTILLVIFIASAIAQEPKPSDMELLGEFLYFDANLSQPDGQSCASCHDPDFGFVDPDFLLPVSEGVLPNRFGDRNSPSAAYAMYSPIRYFDEEEGLWIGGQFWDSRATGEILGDPLADQALGPFTNPVEMANHEPRTVVRDVANSDYKDLYEMVWPDTDLDSWSRFTSAEIDMAYAQVALSIGVFERTKDFAPFNSKYDAYLKTCLEFGGDADDCAIGKGAKAKKAGTAIFSEGEWYGLKLFMGENDNDGVLGKKEGTMCAACHVADWTPAADNVIVPDWAPEGMVPPLFTDFTYDNLGVPQNTEFPFDPAAPPDLGLGPIVGEPEQNGKFKVMTLRNIGLTEPYTHNGFFTTLKEITHFYNTREVGDWPPPEYADTVNHDELGNLGLSDADENALVSFMMTLDDNHMR